MSQNEDFEYAHIERCQTLYNLNRFEESLTETVKGLASFPESFYLHYFKALCHYRMEDFFEAERSSRVSINIDLHNGDGYFLHSIILHKQLNFSGELEMAERAASIDPEDSRFLGRLVEAQLQNGQLKQAQATAIQLVKLEPGSIESHDQLAGICFKLEDWTGVEREYRSALAIQPTNTYYHQSLAQALIQQKKYKDAIDVLFQAVKLESTEKSIQDQLYRAIEQYLPSAIKASARTEALNALPTAIVHFYTDRRTRNDFFTNNSLLFNILLWAGIFAVVVIALKWLGF